MEKILTVVIPSYNVEQTLEKTVRSMLIPNIQLRSALDILIVNDGSKDGTLPLAMQFEKENPGIVRVWNKDNGGHGSTINVGIEQALGKYLKVVDGDDWLDTKALEKYLMILETSDADMVATDYYRYYMTDDKLEAVKASSLPYNEVIGFDTVWDKINFQMHSYAVKTSILRNQPYRIDEHCFYVDTELNVLTAMSAKTILYIDTKLYVYRLQSANQSVSAQGWMKHYMDHDKIGRTFIDWMHSFKQDNNVSDLRIKYMENFTTGFLKFHYRIGIEFTALKRKEFVENLKLFDIWLKQNDMHMYSETNSDLFIRLCRIFQFSQVVYYTASAMIKIKRSVSHGINKAVHSVKAHIKTY